MTYAEHPVPPRSWLFALALSSALACRASSASSGDARPVEHAPAADAALEPRTPATPAADPGQPGEQQPSAGEALQQLLASMGVRYLPAEQRLEVPGWVNMQSGLVEVFACAPEGKTHESVIVLDCVPSGLHAGLLALGLEPGAPVESSTAAEYRSPSGDRVEIQVRWVGADGATNTARAEDWIWDKKRAQAMEHAAWIFTGSFLQPTPGTPDAATYAANYVKSLVTTYHDSTSVLENPWPEGVDDTVYYSNEKAVPPVGTPVTAIFCRGR